MRGAKKGKRAGLEGDGRAGGGDGVSAKSGSRGLALVIFLTVAAAMVLAYDRNRPWLDEVVLWGDVTGKSPGKARGHFNMANAYGDAGRMDEAVAGYKNAIRLNPGYAEARGNLGLAYFSLGLFDEAVQEYETALAWGRYNTEILANLGVALYTKGRLDEAIARYIEALVLGGGHAELHFNLALAYGKKGLMNEASRELREALRIRPDFQAARKLLKALSKD